MAKTVTIRLPEDVYEKFASAAKAERRSISNLIQVLALRKMEEEFFVDRLEMDEIRDDDILVAGVRRGPKEARQVRDDCG